MSLTRIELRKFTAFSDLELAFSPGINVLVGANGTGKTHLMKVCYAACECSREGKGEYFANKLVRVFLPASQALGRLVHRQQGRSKGMARIYRAAQSLNISFSSHIRKPLGAKVTGVHAWTNQSIASAFIPAQEMLANAPGFLSLYETREIHFEEVYRDILLRAYRPLLRGPMSKRRKALLDKIEASIAGKIFVKGEEFFLRNRQGNLEFSLLAEGFRKLGLLWVLIQNGTLEKGSVLFWDEPETNLNPKLLKPVLEILLELQRDGVQIFLATHDYALLHGLDLCQQEGDEVVFHSLYRDERTGSIACNTASRYLDIHPNVIADAFDDLYDQVIARNMGDLG